MEWISVKDRMPVEDTRCLVYHDDGLVRIGRVINREETKLRLLRDIATDITICKLEGWDYKNYLHELKEEIDRFL